MKIILLPVLDYFKTRKRIPKKLLVSLIPALLVLTYSLLFDARRGIDIAEVFANFVNVQISAVAIFISFSIAIITILVSADSENIKRLKGYEAKGKDYKSLKGKPLTLFQVLLSNITYNVLVEILLRNETKTQVKERSRNRFKVSGGFYLDYAQ
jgi:hypothetical protein